MKNTCIIFLLIVYIVDVQCWHFSLRIIQNEDEEDPLIQSLALKRNNGSTKHLAQISHHIGLPSSVRKSLSSSSLKSIKTGPAFIKHPIFYLPIPFSLGISQTSASIYCALFTMASCMLVLSLYYKLPEG